MHSLTHMPLPTQNTYSHDIHVTLGTMTLDKQLIILFSQISYVYCKIQSDFFCDHNRKKPPKKQIFYLQQLNLNMIINPCLHSA